MEKVYLGDGAYAEFDGASEITVFTSNGMGISNQVFLGPDECVKLLAFIKEHMKLVTG